MVAFRADFSVLKQITNSCKPEEDIESFFLI